MSFIWPWMLATLLVIPVAISWYRGVIRRKRLAAAALGPLGLVQNRSGRVPGTRRHLPVLLMLGGLTCLLVGLARPETTISLPRVEGTVILAIDVSNSMTAGDLEPSRIEAAKTAARTLIENQPTPVKIGIVAFGSGGLVVQQPTNDRELLLASIDRLEPQGGTSLGQGIFTSLNAIAGKALAIEQISEDETAEALQIDDYSSAVVVLLTDGENTNEPDPLEIAQIAADAGVRIYPVGVGSLEGSVVEVEGFQILSRLDEGNLHDIADLTNGSYFYAGDVQALQDIFENVDLQLTVAGEKLEITALVAGIGLLFLLAGSLFSLFWFSRMP